MQALAPKTLFSQPKGELGRRWGCKGSGGWKVRGPILIREVGPEGRETVWT